MSGPPSAIAVTSIDTGVVAYTAGSTVIVMDIQSKHQLGFYKADSPGLPLGCLALGGAASNKGSVSKLEMPMFLAAGEQGGVSAQVCCLTSGMEAFSWAGGWSLMC